VVSGSGFKWYAMHCIDCLCVYIYMYVSFS